MNELLYIRRWILACGMIGIASLLGFLGLSVLFLAPSHPSAQSSRCSRGFYA